LRTLLSNVFDLKNIAYINMIRSQKHCRYVDASSPWEVEFYESKICPSARTGAPLKFWEDRCLLFGWHPIPDYEAWYSTAQNERDDPKLTNDSKTTRFISILRCISVSCTFHFDVNFVSTSRLFCATRYKWFDLKESDPNLGPSAKLNAQAVAVGVKQRGKF
jgi:hypothetical protein